MRDSIVKPKLNLDLAKLPFKNLVDSGPSWPIAVEYIERYRTSNVNATLGVYYDISELTDYINNFANMLRSQPLRPENYKWAVGIYHALTENDEMATVIAPVLYTSKPSAGMPEVLDCYEHPEYFFTQFLDPTLNPGFAFDEGHLWP